MPVSTVPYAGLTSPLGGSVINSGTAVASTSGTSINFTDIPSWVKKITLICNAVSTTGSSPLRIRLGYGSTPTYITSGYNAYGGQINVSTAAIVSDTDGFITGISPTAGTSFWLQMTIIKFDPTVNNWNYSCIASSSTNIAGYTAGNLNMSANVLTALRLTTVGGTDTFDAGSINILYE
jgi:hypothetical protein